MNTQIPNFAFPLFLFFASVFPSNSEGQVLLGAPGVGLTYREEVALPFTHSTNLGRYYKFVFTGAEVQADADGVPGTYSYDGFMWDKKKKNNNGHGNNIDGVDSSNPGKSKTGLDTNPLVDDEKKGGASTTSSGSGSTTTIANKVLGWWNFLTKVNSHQITGLTFTTAALNQLSDVIRVNFATPIVLREQVIQLTWSGTGNSQDPDGHLYILGSAIKEPPVPWGSLNLGQSVYSNGTKPTCTWAITRE